MKKRLLVMSLALVSGLIVGTILQSCSDENNVQAAQQEQNYLKYCGTQNVTKNKLVYVYEDTEHNKVVYVASDGYDHPISIAVTDMNKEQ